MNNEASPVPFESVEVATARYQAARKKIKEACDAIAEAHREIEAIFGPKSYIKINEKELYFDRPEQQLVEMDRNAWRHIINRSGVKRFMSVRAERDMESQLANDEKVPSITVETVKGFIEAQRAQLPQFINEAVQEVYRFLRPNDTYKTNSRYDIGYKVILRYMVDVKVVGDGFQLKLGQYADARLRSRALDIVFMLLDRRPPILETHWGPLADAIEMSRDGNGETEFFRFRCCKNENLHLEFKRLDLVAKLNAVAGGRNLYQSTE